MSKPNSKLLVMVLIVVMIGAGAFFVLGDKPTDESKNEVLIGPVEVAKAFEVGSPAPETTFTDFSGNVHSLADYKGKAVVLDFWAAWCPFCVEEMPELQKAHQKHGDDLVIIGMHRTDTEGLAKGKQFAADRGVDYLLASDPDDSLYNAAGGFGMPVAIFIDKEGTVREIKSGPKTAEEIETKTADLVI